jgi:hypothetical protein
MYNIKCNMKNMRKLKFNSVNYKSNMKRNMSRDSSVDTVKSYPLDGHGTDFSLFHSVQTGSGVHLASYPLSAGDSLPGVKAARA